ncbi:YokU family protein [Bacillus idriensis]|uniref:YokU family protein n=1 Tax=Metabacillus idriensis TaxID=324768 RepID=A0A6I2MHY8_9BACI|nr:YokU family protein [Metabacillus idriensis]MRX56696.1 YokU family protein [Metabacillus idriensis]
MSERCEWCESQHAKHSTNLVHWELPDGSRAIEISDTPCISCPDCGISYQSEQTINEIENQLLLIAVKELPNRIAYEELMKWKRHLKRNYFDFT